MSISDAFSACTPTKFSDLPTALWYEGKYAVYLLNYDPIFHENASHRILHPGITCVVINFKDTLDLLI